MTTMIRTTRYLITVLALLVLLALTGAFLVLMGRDSAWLGEQSLLLIGGVLPFVWLAVLLGVWYVWRRQQTAIDALQHATQTLEAQVTAYKEKETSLQQGEKRFRHLVENANDTISIVDAQGRYTYTSPTFERLLGYPPEEIMGTSAFDLAHPDDLPIMTGIFQTILESPGETVSDEYRYRHRDGTWRVLQSTAHNLLDSPAVSGIVVNTRDITERLEAEEEIRRQATRAEVMMQISSRLNAQIDLERTLTVVCEETAKALDVPMVTVSLFDEALQALVVSHSYGVEEEYLRQLDPVPIDALQAYAGDSRLVVTPDVQRLADLPNAELYAQMGLRTTVNALLMRHDHLVGRLNIATVGAVRVFTEGELSLLQGLAAQATQAIINARLFTQARLRLDRLYTLHSIHRAVTALQNLSVTLDTVVDQISAQLAMDAAAVLTFDADQQTLHYAAGTGFHNPGTHRTPIRLGEGYAGRAAQEERILYTSHLAIDAQATPTEVPATEAFVSYYYVPLMAQEKLIGVLELFHRELLTPNEGWLVFLDALALQTAIAINHAILFDRTREQAEQLKQIVDVVPEGMLVLDTDYQLLLANPAAEMCMERNNKTAKVGDTLTHLCHLPVSELATRSAQAPIWQEVTIESPPQTYEVTAQPLQVNDAARGWVLLMRDVTEARRRQTMLQRQERLATVGQLAAGIAHDFNNMLSPILLHAEYNLTQTSPGSRIYTNLEQILQAASRARDLVTRILAFGRKDPNQHPYATMLHAIVQEALDLIRASLPPKIAIELDIQTAAGAVWIDPTQMHQIVMNLCTNAYHAMEAEGGCMTVRLESRLVDQTLAAAHPNLKPGPYVCLTVQDTGHGIEAETLAHIFEPFFTTKEPGKGSGMGLAMVYGIVTEYRGEIVVDSTPGEGTQITIYLPRYDGVLPHLEPQTTQPLATSRSAPPGWNRVPHKPVLVHSGTQLQPTPTLDVVADADMSMQPRAGHILIVDDEAAIVKVAKELLEARGYTVTTATSSIDALALLRETSNAYDLLVTDLNMPEMSGIELVEEMRAVRSDLPVILTSGYHESVPQHKIVQYQIQLLSKPFSIENLRQMIGQTLMA